MKDPVDHDTFEQSVSDFFARVRASETAPEDLWSAVNRGMRPAEAGAGAPAGTAWAWLGGRGRRSVVAGALVASVALFAVVIVTSRFDHGSTVSAEEVVRGAAATIASPPSAGIESLVVTQRWTGYSPADDGRAERVSETRTWYEAPARQRIERDGGAVLVWDGSAFWQYVEGTGSVTVALQAPDVDVYEQGVLQGSTPGTLGAAPYLDACRTARAIGEGTVAGRSAQVIELSRSRCGLVYPWSDGHTVVWVDDETGLVLKTEQYRLDGTLSFAHEVTSLAINTEIDDAILSFSPPAGVEVNDWRESQPPGVLMAIPPQAPAPITLEEARAEATFPVQVPAHVPDGYELESIEHYWGNDQAREHRSHADWVLMRYADPQGNWLVLYQGFGGTGVTYAVRHLSSPPPPPDQTGSVDVEGSVAHWVEWHPDGMLSLGWQPGAASPFFVGVASNNLTLDELITVARSLE